LKGHAGSFGKERVITRERKPSTVACALAAGDYTDRLAWIEDLNADALRNYRREGTRMELTYDPSAATLVREFVRREQQCCSFLDFTIRRETDAVIVEITAPEGTGEVADALFGTYTARRRT
jgi:hypothetical protein